MAMPKTILKKVKVNSASYETHAVFLTDYGRELRDFNKSQGTTLTNQLEYFRYLAECYDEKLADIKNISYNLDKDGGEDFNALLGELENREPIILNR
tara:strand:- start:156 stop:446 length:291 start_codon:yes stop_codon:yes gene_type:complete